MEPNERAAADWFAEEAFWRTSYPFMFPDESFEAAEEEAPRILELADCPAGAVLDQGCGPGRYAVPFARRGLDVTGIDSTPLLLQRARERAESRGLSIEWVQADMREFVRPGAFDLAVNLFTSFGFFDDSEENLKVARNALTSLKPGGAYVVDVRGKELIARDFEPAGSRQLAPGTLVVQRRSVIDGWTRMENEWLFIRDDEVRRFRFRHWMYSGAELRALLARAGFSAVELYGDFTGAEYGPEAKRLIAVGRA